jgi:cation diffusion facilitator CzcD-associated flavoprotein CzcO
VAGGIAPFAWRPPRFDHLPPEAASHTSRHADLSRFAGRRVLVVGGGQSALESAALMHEAGAEVEVIVRADHINWLHGGRYHRKLGRAVPLFYAPHDVGPLGLSRLIGFTDVYRRAPHTVQDPITRRAIRPAGAAWLLPRLEGVAIRLGETIRTASTSGRGVEVELANGGSRVVDHVMFGTGYRVDVSRYPFLAPALANGIRETNGYPILGPGLESSIPRMHFIGAPAAWSFGPTMRFVSGSWYAGSHVARAARGGRQADGSRGRGRSTPSRDGAGPGAAIVSGGGVLE